MILIYFTLCLDLGILNTDDFSWERVHNFWHCSSMSLRMIHFTAHLRSGHFMIISANRSGVVVIANMSTILQMVSLVFVPTTLLSEN